MKEGGKVDIHDEAQRNRRRRLARVASGPPALVVIVLASVSFGVPMSSRFWVGMLVLLGLVISAWTPKGARLVLSATVFVGVSMVLATLLTSGDSQDGVFLQELRIPTGQPLSRWTSLVPERDSALIAVPFVTTHDERRGLTAALDMVYREMETDVGARRATQLRTIFGHHSPSDSDAHLHEEGDGRDWVVFLHGLGGNAASGCWVIAKSAARSGWSTLCPSTSFDGRWWQGDGPNIVNEAVSFARSRGAERLVLAGYSNGASGALHVLDTQALEFEGLILLSGYRSSIDARTVSLPTLVLSGESDERCSAEALESWAAELPSAETQILPGADHMMIIKDRVAVSGAVSSFLLALAPEN